ncbi:MAG: hypothetical protein ABR526_00685 [Chthoniobacterales bacterium]
METRFLPPNYSSGVWSDPTKWSPAEVPNDTASRFYNVTLSDQQSVAIDIDPTIHNLTGEGRSGLQLYGHNLTVVEAARFTSPLIQISGGTFKAGTFSTGAAGVLTGFFGLISYPGNAALLQFPGAHITSLQNAQITLSGTGAGVIDENSSNALRDLAKIDSQSTLHLNNHAFTVSAPVSIEGIVRLSADASASSTFTAVNGIGNYDATTKTLSGGTFILNAPRMPQPLPTEFRFAGADIVNNGASIQLNGEESRFADLNGLDAMRNFARNMPSGELALSNRTLLVARNFTNDGVSKLVSSTLAITGTLTNLDAATRTLRGGSWTLNHSSVRFANADIVHNGGAISLANGSTILDGSGSDALRGFTDNLAGGTFIVGIGQSFNSAAGFTNAGRVETQPAPLFGIPESTPPPAGQFTVASAAAYTQTSGATINDGVLTAGRVEISGGALSGSGTINGDVTVGAATVNPGGDINGNLTLSPATRVHCFVDRFSTFSGWRRIAKNVALAGALEVEIRYENYLGSTATFTLLSATQVSGAFSNAAEGARVPTTDGSGSFVVHYEPTRVKLSDFQANPPPRRLLNISTRGFLKRADNDTFGDSVLTGGFIVNGAETKKVVIRGIGPTLGAYGVASPVQDPRIDLYNADRQVIATNDSWRDAQQPEIASNGLAPNDEREAALVAQLPPGVYTVALRDNTRAGGGALIEIYDLTSTDASKLVNISTRGFLDAGNPLVGGIIAREGQANAELVVRALGPQLRRNGVFDAVDDPMLELRDANGAVIAANDDWVVNPDQVIRELQPAFPSESAMRVSLLPGSYTAIVRAKGGGEGQALVEFYDLRR